MFTSPTVLPAYPALPSYRSATNHTVGRIPRFNESISPEILSFKLRHEREGSLSYPYRIVFVTYGPIFHLRLLPTPLRSDAVTFGYKVQTELWRGLTPCRFDTYTGAPMPAALGGHVNSTGSMPAQSGGHGTQTCPLRQRTSSSGH